MGSFTEKRKGQLGISSVGEQLRQGRLRVTRNPLSYVNGPKFIDCLHYPWSRGQMMGIIGASGSGKTELVLEIFEHILRNNPDPNSICVFVSLENTVTEIAHRWLEKVGEDSPLSERLHVISNYLEDGSSRCLSAFGITSEVSKIKNVLNADVICTAVDHLHIIERKENEDLNKICQYLKNASVELNTFVMVLSQTQKSGNVGDIPLDQNASYDCSQFAWISSYVITIHNPLKKVGDQTKLNILSWQYAKIRDKHHTDPVKVGINQLLSYDMESRKLTELSEDEKTEFGFLYSQVLELRQAEEKTKFAQYNLGKKRLITNEQKVFKNQ